MCARAPGHFTPDMCSDLIGLWSGETTSRIFTIYLLFVYLLYYLFHRFDLRTPFLGAHATSYSLACSNTTQVLV